MSTGGSNASTAAIEPWLSVPDAGKALDFYRNAFGAVEAYRLDDDDGRPVVAQLSIGGAAFWIQGDADASPVAPGVRSVRMILSVEDPERAVRAGGGRRSRRRGTGPRRAWMAHGTADGSVRARLGSQPTTLTRPWTTP